MATSPDATIKQTQGYLNQLGFNCGVADGVWGNNSQNALYALVKSAVDTIRPLGVNKVCWGTKFTPAEINKVASVIANLGLPKESINDLMACMAWETGETFSPSVRSPVSSATGLIQFMEATAAGMGTTTAKLAKMTVIEQLDYVEKYFKPYAKRLQNLGDLYMAIIWPVGIAKPDSYVMWQSGDKQFDPNKGLDLNADGKILRIECLHKVNNKMVKGFLSQYVRAA